MPSGIYPRKPLSEEHKAKLSRIFSGRKLPEFTAQHRINISNALRGKVKTFEHKKKNSEALLGRKLTKEHCKKISIGHSIYIMNSRRKRKGFTNTKPERLMKVILKELCVKFRHSYPVMNIIHKYPADFFIPSMNLIIEVDGKYWHNFPYGTEIDKIRTAELKQAGYKVLRFWECEFNRESVRESLKKI